MKTIHGNDKRNLPLNKTVLITGGTGMIGSRLTEILLKDGYQVIVLTRRTDLMSKDKRIHYATWSPAEHRMDSAILSDVHYIVNLAGENIGAKRWTSARKRLLLKSRTDSVQTLIKALEKRPGHLVQAIVSASAIGWYGSNSNSGASFYESDLPANDFLGSVCAAWEAALRKVEALGLRWVILRTGLVLAPGAGALQEMKKPFNFNPALVLGSGNQVQSWIHLEDICRAYQFCVEHSGMRGVFNAVTPSPLPYRALVEKIARFRHEKSFLTLRIPALFLRLAMGEMAELVLNSVTVSSDKLAANGFQFRYPELNTETLQALSKR